MAEGEQRRRLIREEYPELAPNALSNLQSGYSSQGVRATRAYITVMAAMIELVAPEITNR
jgi:hypothetical protein